MHRITCYSEDRNELSYSLLGNQDERVSCYSKAKTCRVTRYSEATVHIKLLATRKQKTYRVTSYSEVGSVTSYHYSETRRTELLVTRKKQCIPVYSSLGSQNEPSYSLVGSQR